jgi:hypothetical protein
MKYPDYPQTNRMFVNASSLDMYTGDEVQLKASPADATFEWSSDNEAVVAVSPAGLVTAVSEGLATVTVASGEDAIKIDVRVKTFIPLRDITFGIQLLELDIYDQTQVWAYPVPEDASEYSFTWTSTDPDVVTVDQDGTVTPANLGTAEIVVASGEIERRFTVRIIEKYTSMPIQFNGQNSAMSLSWNNAGYWDMDALAFDPYCYTTGITTNLREKTSVIFVVEYQSSHELNDGQIFYCTPNPTGGISTEMNLHFDYTGIDPADETLWREFRLDLADARSRFSWGDSGHRLRFDYTQDTRARILVRNAQILYR